jgi:hypothetical protein
LNENHSDGGAETRFSWTASTVLASRNADTTCILVKPTNPLGSTGSKSPVMPSPGAIIPLSTLVYPARDLSPSIRRLRYRHCRILCRLENPSCPQVFAWKVHRPHTSIGICIEGMWPETRPDDGFVFVNRLPAAEWAHRNLRKRHTSNLSSAYPRFVPSQPAHIDHGTLRMEIDINITEHIYLTHTATVPQDSVLSQRRKSHATVGQVVLSGHGFADPSGTKRGAVAGDFVMRPCGAVFSGWGQPTGGAGE